MPRPVWSKSLPIALWPPADREAWEVALKPGDAFESGGIASGWAAATRRKTALGYGRFLVWLRERGELDEEAAPVARVTRERAVAYLGDLKRSNKGHTPHNRIQELGDAMRALAPESDWRWLLRARPAECAPARSRPTTSAPACARSRSWSRKASA